MNVLVVGGTMFLGRYLVRGLRERGHLVTMFNRGKSHPDLFPEVPRVIGDRRSAEDLDQLRGMEWDAVIDTSAYFPKDVELLLDRIAPTTGHYAFISSISVYRPSGSVGQDEGSPVVELTGEMSRTEITGENYGALKAAAENLAEELMPGRVLVVRPGLIVGPDDPTDRFTWWAWRMERGGPGVPAPGDPDEPVQFIDVRDLADWTIRMVEARRVGTFNATGPAEPVSMKAFLESARRTLAPGGTTLRWYSEKELLNAGVAPWREMPLWIPAADNGMSRSSIRRALDQGLTTRPVEETLRDTLDWFRTTDRYATGELRAGGGESKLPPSRDD